MAREIDHVLAQVELFVDIPHGCLFRINPLQSFRVALIEVGDIEEKRPETALFKEPHETCGGENVSGPKEKEKQT